MKSDFEAGSIKNLGTVKGLDWVGPKYYFMPATEMVDGTYLIVVEGDGKLLAAEPIDPSTGNSYGYLPKNDVTDLVDYRGFIAMEDLKDAFVFSNTSQGYSVKQAYNGLYWYQDGSYNTISVAESISQYYSVAKQADGSFKITNKAKSKFLQYRTGYGSFGSYSSAQSDGLVPILYRLVDPETVSATVTLATLDASGVTGSSAVLNASYSGLFPVNPVNVGFYYGTSASNLENEVNVNDVLSTSSGTISAEIASLSEKTTYYYQVKMEVWDPVTNAYKEFLGEIKSFTTGESAPVTNWKGWLELPANTLTADNYIYDEQKVGTERNYAMSYDISTYAAMWVAYPLYSTTIGTQNNSYSRPGNWSYNGHFSSGYQVDIRTKSYGVNWTESYGNELYARGHQIPNADRNNSNVSSSFQSQTFLVTNSTPQIQNKFNGAIWGNLEDGVRSIALQTDTVYVITGPVFQKVGETKTIKYIRPQLDPNKQVPVPNYYWKALLKVKWSGKTVTSASAIGFWYEHKSYVNGEKYDDSQFIVSVKDIEDWTGLDLFANLPGDKDNGIEKTAQENTNLRTFKNF